MGRHEFNDAVARVGTAIKREREARQITQEDLAHDAGISLRQLRNVELGTSNPTLVMLYRISAVLEIPLPALLARAEHMHLR